MRMDIRRNGGYGSGQTSSAGATFTGPVYLYGNPVQQNEAAPKQYVDSVLNTHTTNTSLHLASTEKSLISNISVSYSDINRLSGIISNVQNQLNSKVALEGGAITGSFTLNNNPTIPLHAVTKQYADTTISTLIGLKIGDIITKTTNVTPNGFLRANGSFVSKSLYSSLYTIIGNNFDDVTNINLNYSSHSAIGSGQPWRQQYDISQTGDGLGSWVTANSLPSNINGNPIVTKNRVYLLGGADTSIYTALINPDGTLGAWVVDTNVLPSIIENSFPVVIKNRVYLLGSYNGTNVVSTIYSAPINVDGTLGTFIVDSSVLPGGICASQVVVTKNRIYLLGGETANAWQNAVSTVYTAPINMDGTLGIWTTGAALPTPLVATQAIVTQNRVYLLGGFNGSAWINTVYTAPINADGTLGAWTTGPALPAAFAGAQSVVTKNRVYLLQGSNGNGSNTNIVYTAPVNTDGTLGAWTTGPALPNIISYSRLITTKNRIYLLGGSGTTIVYTAQFIGAGLNDYTKLYNGSVNLFDGTDLTGMYTIYNNNPDPTTLFSLPDSTQFDQENPNTYSYIKY